MNLYWDYQNQKIVTSLYSAATPVITWVLRDLVPINLFCVIPYVPYVSNQPYIATEFLDGYTFKLAGKVAGSFKSNPLFSCSYWEKIGTGSACYYQGCLRLENPALIAAMEGDSSSSMEVENLKVTIEIAAKTDEGEQVASSQLANVSIILDLMRDDDSDPVPVDFSSSSSLSSSSSNSSSDSSLSSLSSASSLSSLSSISDLSSEPA